MIHRPEKERDTKLERVLSNMLHALPARRAPVTLEARILRELERRVALPWWRRSFAHWPLPVRAAFVALCVGFTSLTLLGGNWAAGVLGKIQSSDASTVAVQQAIGLLSVASALATLPTRLIPPWWLYSTLTTSAALYAMLFGLGGLAYRTLYLKPRDGR